MDELVLDELGYYHSKKEETNAKICHENLIRRLKDLSFKTEDDIKILGYKDSNFSVIKNKYGKWIYQNMGDLEDTLCCCGHRIKHYSVIINPSLTAKCYIGSQCIKNFFGDAKFKLINDEIIEIKKNLKKKEASFVKHNKFRYRIVMLELKTREIELRKVELTTRKILEDWYNSKLGFLNNETEYEKNLIRTYEKFKRVSKNVWFR